MAKKYNFKEIEKRWQKKWLEEKVFRASDKPKNKYYQLETFPYPSAAGLHVGHPKGYIAEDIHARFMRMNGYDVLYTMGWDAFGLPTENYAIKVGKSPQEVAEENIKNFKRQVRMFGLSYDWDREINTSNPEYYKWTQWLFVKLFEKGLAYRKKATVNWCPKDQTVLAHEQVIEKSKIKNQKSKIEEKISVCERCETPVEQKEMEQWFLKITDYAERLLNDLEGSSPVRNRDGSFHADSLRDRHSASIFNRISWPEASIKRQKDWIGKSEGAELDFEIKTAEPPNFVLIHGYNSSPDKHFFPWLKKELEKLGYKVQAPALPHPEDPRVYDQAEHVLKTVSFDENTIILGHSLGSVVAMKVLEKLKQPVRKTVLVGGFMENNFIDNDNFEEETFDWKFDFKRIAKNAGAVVSLRDLEDDAVPQYQPKKLAEIFSGRLIDFTAVKPHARASEEPEILRNLLDFITVFTTRPDTLFGATYMVLAPENPLIANNKRQIANWKEVQKYIKRAKHKTELQRQEEIKDKTGVELKGIKAINPATKEEIPVWIADYVLMGYGTGAIMAVPAHDERDNEFAVRHNLPIKKVVATRIDADFDADLRGKNPKAYTGEGTMLNSEKFDGMRSEEARWEITKFVGGRRKVQYRLRDWSVSRQRYWGCPIPMIYCERCGVLPVPENDLPVILPPLKNYRPKGVPPLASSKEFISVKCSKCGGEARRDPETLDTFVDSSWYFLRYTDPHNREEIFDKKKAAEWLPVDLYIIGAEHTTLHLLYARFITKFLHDIGYLKFNEPFLKLRHQGLILGEDGQKMSKSKGNVVNPDEIVGEFGADTVRLYEMFMGPFEQGQPWDPKGVLGVHRFLNRVWSLMQNAKINPFDKPEIDGEQSRTIKNQNDNSKIQNEDKNINRLLHKTVKKIGDDIRDLKFNTAISALMILLNEMEKQSNLSFAICRDFIKILYPFAPHLAQDLWSQMGNETYLDFERWPEYDENLIRDERITLVVQVNGKVRDSVEAGADIKEEEAKKVAIGSEKVRRYLGGKEPKKIIYVKGKLVNIVI